jgi:lipopolysaccharide export system protein LptA
MFRMIKMSFNYPVIARSEATRQSRQHSLFFLDCFVVALLAMTLCAPAFALETDKNEPISVQADSVTIDNKTGESQYIGNVSVINGSTHLTAAKAIVHTTKNNTIQEAEAFGNSKAQAHYWTLTDPKKPALNAYADIIRIFPDKHLVYLIGHAKVSQGEDLYEAPRIEYNNETQHVFSPQSSQGRTTIVIHPQEQPK